MREAGAAAADKRCSLLSLYVNDNNMRTTIDSILRKEKANAARFKQFEICEREKNVSSVSRHRIKLVSFRNNERPSLQSFLFMQ